MKLKIAATLVIVCLALPLMAAEIPVNLQKAAPSSPLVFGVDPASFDIKIVNAIPGQTYEITDESKTVKFDELGNPPATAAPCTDAAGRATAALRGKTTEADIAKAVDASEVTSCNAEQQTAIKTEIGRLTSKVIGTGYKIPTSGELKKTLKRLNSDAVWLLSFRPQGQPAPEPPPPDNLTRLRDLTAKQPSLTVMRCSYADDKCLTDALYVNADQISTLTITDIPKGRPLTVKATAGEYFPCALHRYNLAKFAESPDVISVSMYVKRGGFGLFGGQNAQSTARAASLYGLGTDCTTDPRLNDSQPSQPSPPNLPLLLRGKSEVVEVQFSFGPAEKKTFTIPIRYQRFWLDAGGFFVFARHVDEQLEFEDFSSTQTTRTVRRILKDTSTDPVTGIVINVHPGNTPVIAVQFGIAANQGKLPSYYLGLGVRAREIGKRGLATLGIGVAMQQENRFNLVDPGETLPSDSPRLQASKKYGFNPYLSISLGFSFGGVSEGTNVAAAVSRN